MTEPKTPGQVAYEAYVAAAHPVVGDALMRWEDTNMRYRAIWEAAAQAVMTAWIASPDWPTPQPQEDTP